MHGRRGQSETVGVILLTLVVVALTMMVGGVILSQSSVEETLLVDVAVETDGRNVSLVHEGGDPLEPGDTEVIFRSDVDEHRYRLDAANISGDDGVLDPGERWTRAHGVSGQTMQVLLVHDAASAVVFQTAVDIPFEGVLGLLDWNTSSDWDGPTRQSSVVHDDFGDHDAEFVELGHPRTGGSLVAYWPLDDAAGATTATEVANGNDGTFGSPTHPTPDRQGVFNTTAYEFSSGDSITVADSSSLDRIAATDAVTVGGWVKTTDENGTVFSQYDGFDRGSGSDDVVFGLREGRPAALVGADGAIAASRTRDTESEWGAGSFNDTTTAGGALELEQSRANDYGVFAAPSTTGSMQVDTGFDPDLVVFRTVVTGTDVGTTTSVGGQTLGTGTGYVDCTTDPCTAVAQAFSSGSASPNGKTAAASSLYGIYQPLTGPDGNNHRGFVKGEITATDEDGFTVTFDEVQSDEPQVLVAYRAYKFDDGASVDVGSFRTPDDDNASATGTQSIDTGFKPNSVQVLTGPDIIESDDTEVNNNTEFGWSRGWAIDNESRTPTSTTTVVGEAGRVTLADSGWTEISFNNSYTDPVVVGTTNTHAGDPALTFSVSNVTSNTADVRLCESNGTGDQCDGTHGQETAGYLVIDAAKADQVEGLDAGTVDVSGSHDTSATSVSYGESFGSTPVVAANVQTVDGGYPLEAHLPQATSNDFLVGMCKQDGEDSCDGGHVQETVGWVAIDRTADPFNEHVEAGIATGVEDSAWTEQTFDTAFGAQPAVVVSTQSENGGQDSKIDEAKDVTTSSVDVRYCEIEDGTSCDTHNGENVAWLAAATGSLTVTSEVRNEQVVLSQSAYANNIDDHVYAANDRQLVHSLWTNKGGIDGRVVAHLDSFDSDGFTLDYTKNNPDEADGDRFLATYVAVETESEPELGYAETPTATGTQTYDISAPVAGVSLYATNLIPAMDTEGYSGSNRNDNHLGWMAGAGSLNHSDGSAVGFSSHSNSVNAHAVGSRTDRGVHLLYTDQNGNRLGRDAARLAGASADDFTLDWTAVATTGTDADVKYSQVPFVWHSYGTTEPYEATGNYTSPVRSTDHPVHWNGTRRTETVPSGTGVDVDYWDGSQWHESIGSVPKTDQFRYNVTLTGDGSTTPTVDRLRTYYRSLYLHRSAATDTESQWTSGQFTNTTTDGEGSLQLAGEQLGEAGTITATAGEWTTVTFDETYTDPVVVGTTNTHDGPAALTFDARAVTGSSAEIRVCEAEGGTTDGCDSSHGTETIGYVVIDAAETGDVDGIEAGTVNRSGGIDDASTVSFGETFGANAVVLANVQTTAGAQPVETRVRDTGSSDFTVGICHTGSVDGCNDSHVSEEVGWVALDRVANPFVGTTEIGRTGNVVGNSEWTTQSFEAGFSGPPVVVASTITEDGGQELQIDEARDVTASDVEVRYCEIETGDDCNSHTSEDVSWFAAAPGPLVVSYRPAGYYHRTIDAGRTVDWTSASVNETAPGSTTVEVEYATDGTWHDSIADVPDDSTLRLNVSLSGGTETPTVDDVTAEYNETGWRLGTANVADGQWHHVAATYDGSTLTTYVDGQPDRTMSVSTSIDASSTDRKLGSDGALGLAFAGKIDAVRLSDRALDGDAVRARYNASTNGTLVTGTKSFPIAVNATELQLENVTAWQPSGTDITVVVESDRDGDGVFEQASDPISLSSGGGPYAVSGLSADSAIYRLRVDLSTDDPTKSPVFASATLNQTT